MSLFTTTGLLPALLVTLIALASARLLVRDTSATDNHEFASIDGIRGFLALFVFLHHSVYWFNYSHLKGWNGSDSGLYNNFGDTSVCLFFMLSGFLFFNKLLEGRTREIDWLKLFCSRFLRLTPLYITLVGVIVAIIAIESSFIQLEDTKTLRSNIISWLLFTIPGHPDINAHGNTHLMVAGVIWTLPYEWFFYFCLPALGLLVGAKGKANSGIWLILSVACILSFSLWQLDSTLLFGFAGGGFAAFVARTPWLRQLHRGKGTNWVLLAGLVIAYTVFDTGNFYYTRLLILTVCMSFIACGANLFGILSSRAARSLSTVSYGIYLMHGLTLYLVLNYGLGSQIAQHLSNFHYWLVIFVCTPILVGVSTLSWYWIEWPAIKSVSRLTNALRNFHSAKSNAAPSISIHGRSDSEEKNNV
ncbi:MAG: acyltransferase [Gammaproteobacteria bacterium]|nr:MAG: acyltransferase [Gammaproteobacteria bacterium]